MAGLSSWDCQPAKCQHIEHAEYIMACIIKYNLRRLKNVFKTTCKNASKISDQYGRCALHMAVSVGKYDVAKWLIEECSAEIHLKDVESGWNALHRSLFYGNIDCAILLLKNGLDFSARDKDGVNPLKLVLLDSQRSKLLQNENIRLGRVILPYHASAAGELSLQIDQLVDVLEEYKSTGWALGRLYGHKEKGKFPLNFVEILGNKETDFSADQLIEKGHQSDAYLWGSNSNFTLGQSDTKNRETPELVETLHTQKCSIVQVAVSKYHTVFLCSDGSVFSCGQGRGGRLGHGNEQTVLSPKRISGLDGVFCTAISNANDHTLTLDQMGQVYSFGLNTYHQLGHYPVKVHCLVPKLIQHKQLKGKVMTGIAAARFHSAIHTKHELFTFGLNAGQLGHLKGDNWQSVPRLVSSIGKSDCSIESVAVSDGTTCCSLSNGDIFLLQDYSCRRIATKMMNIKKMVVTGGELRCQVLTDLHHQDPEELQIALLKADGMVFVWRQGYGSFKECFWAGKKRDLWHVIDVSLGKHLLLATNEGVVFHGHFRSAKSTSSSHNKSSPSRLESKGSSILLPSNGTLDELYSRIKGRKEDCEEVMIERVPLLYRAYSISCDVKSKSFAVIQNDPRIGMKSVVKIAKRTLNGDLGDVLQGADMMDNIHDVIVKVKGGQLPAHRFILVSKVGNGLSRLIKPDDALDKFVLDLQQHDMNIVQRWLSAVYTGKTHATFDSFKSRSCHTHEGDGDLANGDSSELDALLMMSLSLRDIENPDCRGTNVFCDEKGNVHESIHSAKKSKKRKEQMAVFNSKKSNMSRMEGKGIKFWKQMENLSDINIEAEDGSVFHCHKCILVGRLEYFKGMLSSPWMESNWTDRSIKIPMPSRVLRIILDFAYTDEAPELQDCLNSDLLCDVILYSDQWLIVRLKEICESSLTKQLSLKNALEMLNFACTYNAEILKAVCSEFVCNNLGYFLETRFLEAMPPDVLSQLSKAYKKIIPNMDYRIITPPMDFTGFDELSGDDEQAAEMKVGDNLESEADIFHDNTKQEKSTRDKCDSSSKKKRRRRKSSSVREASFCEESVAAKTEKDPQLQAEGDILNGFSFDAEEDGTNSEVIRSGVANEVLEKEGNLSQGAPNFQYSTALGVKGLREIMQEEESLKSFLEVKNEMVQKPSRTESSSSDGATANISIKWDSSKKRSQKQRKEKLKSNGMHPQRTIEQPLSEKEKSDVKMTCPWIKSDTTPVKSLQEVMNEEMIANTPRMEAPSHQNNVSSGTRRKLTWKESERVRETKSSSSNDGAWNSMPSSPPSSAMSLSAIIKSQTEEKLESNKILRKPLQLIQIEEKAIEELLLHYNAKDNPAEYITVKRTKDVADSPVWNINNRV